MAEQTPAENRSYSPPIGTVEVILKHQGIENKIIGAPDGVVRGILAYFSRAFPSLELLSKLVLTPDNTEFMQACTNSLASTKEGLAVLREVSSLRDKELIMLYLCGSKLQYFVAAREADTITLDELTRLTGRATGTVAGRLSELCNEQLAERAGKGSYRLTTMGTRTAVKTLLPKVSLLPER